MMEKYQREYKLIHVFVGYKTYVDIPSLIIHKPF